MSGRTRQLWIPIATVCVTAAATATNGGFLLTIPLVLGLIAMALEARRGQWLMWMGAAFLTVTILFMEIAILPEGIAEMHSHHQVPGLLLLWIASILLIVCCDIWCIIDAVKAARTRIPPQRRAPNAGDWIVWIAALLFTVYSFCGIPFLLRAYSHGFDRRDIVLTALATIAIAIVFDTALMVDAVRQKSAALRSGGL